MNLAQGTTEDYLDNATMFNTFQSVNPVGLDLKDLMTVARSDTYFSRMSIDESKIKVLQELTENGMVKLVNRTRPAAFVTDIIEPETAKLSEPKDVLKFMDPLGPSDKQLHEGSKRYQDLKKELSEMTYKMEAMKRTVNSKDQHLEHMRTHLLKDVVTLRDMLYRKNQDKISDEDIYRVDYFTVADIGDEMLVRLLNERIQRVEGIFKKK